jgi:hypothetical protein
MKRVWRRYVGLGALLAALAPLAAADPVPDDTDRNARRLQKWRAYPSEYERLLADFEAFNRLPPERQEQLREIDRAVYEQDALTQDRLLIALENYADWRQSLSDEERRQIDACPNKAERLKAIRRLRDEQYVRRLPAAVREKMAALPPEERSAQVARLREEERQRRLRFQRDGMPARLDEFPPEVRAFVKDTLRPMLSWDEKHHLDVAEGKWPTLAHTVLELSEKHRVLPPLPTGAVVRWDDVPGSARPHVHPRHHRELKLIEGRWPDYALAVNRAMRQDFKGGPKGLPALGASKPAEFPPETRTYITDEMYPKLPEAARRDLKAKEGRWPDYPEALHDAARQFNLVIPGMSLPGPRDLWDAARLATPDLPELPDVTLRHFALLELTPKERAELKLSATDPTSRDRLRQEYFRRYPEELKKRRPERP